VEAATVAAAASAMRRTRLRGWGAGLDAEHGIRRLDLKVETGVPVLELTALRHVADVVEATWFVPVAGLLARSRAGEPGPALKEARPPDSAEEPEGVLVFEAGPWDPGGRALDAET
jgi:hypothetical protein